MSRVVLSIGSNLGDRLARLQAAVDGLGDSVKAVSPVYETDAWGGVSQPAFLNAVVIADDDRLDAHGWLHRAQALELDNERVRTKKWGPRTLDVDLICCFGEPLPGHGISGHGISGEEIFSHDAELTLPHPFAHERAFVLLPWLAIDPAAQLTVGGQSKPVQELLSQLEPIERDGVRPTVLTLTFRGSRR
jgi:2-amino-4-hydroxy-6-hydroxymethyldihydropteridine diphosphokinase